MAPGAVATPWAAQVESVAALFLAGQGTGAAWADVLTGAVNPSGRLPITFPVDDSPTPCNSPSFLRFLGPTVSQYLALRTTHCAYDEGLQLGWRGLVGKPVAFPFGHGLSYTTFACARHAVVQPRTSSATATADSDGAHLELRVSGERRREPELSFQYSGERHGSPSDVRAFPLFADAWEAPPTLVTVGDERVELTMRVRITNEGALSGADVVQIYVAFPEAADEPPLLLRDFEKTRLLAPGEAASLSFRLPAASALAVWRGAIDDASGGWHTVPGNYSVRVGPSSRDARLVHGFEVTGW